MQSWTHYEKTWKEFYEEELSKPGTYIKVRTKWYEGTPREEIKINEYLIGDINPDGGTCSCCAYVSDKDIIMCYLVPKEREVLVERVQEYLNDIITAHELATMFVQILDVEKK